MKLNKKNILIIIFLVIAAFFLILNLSFSFKNHKAVLLFRDGFDIDIYFKRASWLTENKLPYKEVFCEYPQLALAYFTFPLLFTKNFLTYQKIIFLLNAIGFLFFIYFTLKLLEFFKKPLAYVFLFFLPSSLYFVFNRYEILVILITQISLYLLLTKKYKLSFFFLGLAVLTKWYPVLFFPLYLLPVLNSGNKRMLKKVVLIFFLTIFFPLFLSSIFLGVKAVLSPYLFHLSRSGGSGSLYGIFSLLFSHTFLEGSVLALLLALQFSLPAFYFFKLNDFKKRIWLPQEIVKALLLIVLVFILFSKFYSPQWILWFLPFLILVTDWKGVYLVIIYDLLNYLQYPIAWVSVDIFSLPFNLLVLFRSLILICLILRVGRDCLLPFQKVFQKTVDIKEKIC